MKTKSLISKLGNNILNIMVRASIQCNSYQFIADAIGWNRSEVAERLLNRFIPARSSTLSYVDDSYHLRGTRSSPQYLLDTRRCFTRGIFEPRYRRGLSVDYLALQLNLTDYLDFVSANVLCYDE